MLVLSRKVDESIIIGGTVVLRVVEIQGDRVKLGLVAPSTVPILRGELLEPEKKRKKKKHGLERPAT